MKPSPSAGSDGVNMKMITDFYPTLREPIYNLIKTTITTGQFPHSLKTSRVIPLFKGGALNTTECKSYHPENMCTKQNIRKTHE